MSTANRPSLVQNCLGFVRFKHLVLILVLMGGYGGYSFAPVYFKNMKVQSSIEFGLDSKSHRKSDEEIKAQIMEIASTVPVLIDEDSIHIARVRREGERIFNIDFIYPYTVSYLGSEQTRYKHVHLTKVIQVREAEEAQYEAMIKRHEDKIARWKRKSAENQRKIDEAMEECEEKWGKGGCTFDGPLGMGPDDDLNVIKRF